MKTTIILDASTTSSSSLSWQIQQSNSGSTTYVASPAGYGDEGKLVWMARISGTYEQEYIKDGYMSTTNGLTEWKDETSFGNYSSTGAVDLERSRRKLHHHTN